MKDTFDYDQLFEFVMLAYMREFGERKFKTVFEKVMTSNKISGLISKARFNIKAPNHLDLLYSLNEIPYFIFSRGQTQAVGALIGLQRWNEEVNSYQLLLNDHDLKKIALRILDESKSTFF